MGDAHLCEEDPGSWAAFFNFLRGPAREAPELYLLGDIFNAWVGDDDQRELACEAAGRLRDIAAAGVRVSLLPGNHDFLLGAKFASIAGARLLGEQAVVTCAGERILLMHGDILCTADVKYQRSRRFWTNPLVRGCARRLPMRVRIAKAKAMTGGSVGRKAFKAGLLKVDENLAARLAHKAGARMLVHGHVHAPAVHRSAALVRAVVPAWPAAGGTGGWVELAGGNLRLSGP